jgi:hypothetical protein
MTVGAGTGGTVHEQVRNNDTYDQFSKATTLFNFFLIFFVTNS